MDRYSESHLDNQNNESRTADEKHSQCSENCEPSTSTTSQSNSQEKKQRRLKRSFDKCEPSTSSDNQSNSQAKKAKAERISANCEPSTSNSEPDPYQQVKKSKAKRLQGLPLEKAEVLRVRANEHERERQLTLKQAFDKLKMLNMPYNPYLTGHKENSKYYLLVNAKDYIQDLTEVLAEDDRRRNSGNIPVAAPVSTITLSTVDENKFLSSSTADKGATGKELASSSKVALGSTVNTISSSSTVGLGNVGNQYLSSTTIRQVPFVHHQALRSTSNQIPVLPTTGMGYVRNPFPASSKHGMGYARNHFPASSTSGMGYVQNPFPASSNPVMCYVQNPFPASSNQFVSGSSSVRRGSVGHYQGVPRPNWSVANVTNQEHPYRFVGHPHHYFLSRASHDSNQHYTGQTPGLMQPPTSTALSARTNVNCNRSTHVSPGNFKQNTVISCKQISVIPSDARLSSPLFSPIHLAQSTPTIPPYSTQASPTQPNTSMPAPGSQFMEIQQSLNPLTDLTSTLNSHTELNVSTNQSNAQSGEASDTDLYLDEFINSLTSSNFNFDIDLLDAFINGDRMNSGVVSCRESSQDSGIGSNHGSSI